METTTSAKSVESIGTTLRNVQNPTTVQNLWKLLSLQNLQNPWKQLPVQNLLNL